MAKQKTRKSSPAAAGAAPAVKPVPAPHPATPRENLLARHRLLPLFLILPFPILYWLCPFFSQKTIGMDYPIYSIGSQLDLLFSLKHGVFPLYWPRWGDGCSAAALTLGQLFHPLTWLAGLVPGYWGGRALAINTVLKLLELGLAHYVFYRFLRRLRLGGVFALALSLVAVYNLRMLDLFRYGAGLENYTAYLMLLAAIGFEWLSPGRRGGVCAIAICAWLLIAGGHPQMMYYGFLGAGALTLLMPFYLAAVLPEAAPDARRLKTFYVRVFAATVIGGALASAYVIPYYFDFLRNETGRQGLNYEWGLSTQDSIPGTLNAFFSPFRADVHGNFGGSALLVLALLAPLALAWRVRLPRAVWLLWGFLVLVLCLQTGSHTPLYYVFWRFMPMASSMREPGRLAMLNPATAALLLAWLASRPARQLRLGRWRGELTPIAALAVLGLVVFVGWNLLPLDRLGFHGKFAPLFLSQFGFNSGFNNIPSSQFILVWALGLASLAGLILYGALPARRRVLGAVLIAAVALQTAATLRYGTWMVQAKPTETYEELSAARAKLFGCQAAWAQMAEQTRAAQTHSQRGAHRRTELARLHNRYASFGSPEEVYQALTGNEYGPTLFVEGFDPASEPAAPPPPVGSPSTVSLAWGSVNRLVFKTDAPTPSFLTLTFPYAAGRWKATVNGNPARIYPANGVMEQAVRVPAGPATVEFRYVSTATTLGFLISFTVACALALWMLSTLQPGRRRTVLMAATAMLFVALFVLWRLSLYGGESMGTVFNAAYPVS